MTDDKDEKSVVENTPTDTQSAEHTVDEENAASLDDLREIVAETAASESASVESPEQEEIPVAKDDEPNRTTGHDEQREIVSEATVSDDKMINERIEDVLALLMAPLSEMSDASSKELAISDKVAINKYASSVYQAIRNHVSEEQEGNTPFDQDGAYWQQLASHDTGLIGAARPRMAHSRNGVISPKNAGNAMRSAVGLGSTLSVPLWHTGIWVRLDAPMNITLLELQRRIGMSKISLGRNTSGAAFNNTSVYIYTHLIDMILEHVAGSTLGNNVTVQQLKETILVTDMPALIWGMASIIWPNGYPLVRPCVSDPTKCNHVDEAHINIGRLHWVNDRALSTFQRNLMSKRENVVTKEQLEQYQTEHVAPQEKLIEVNDATKISLKVPTIAEYFDAGHRWVDNIVASAHDAFGNELSDSERDDYVAECAAASRLRVYSHWVNHIAFYDNDEEVSRIEEREGIENALEVLTPDTELCDDIIGKIDAYIPQSIISAIGIPRYQCPACKGSSPDEGALTQLPEILQLEVAQVFFTLMQSLLKKVMLVD